MKKLFPLLVVTLLTFGTALANDAAAIRSRTAERRPVIVALVKAGAVEEADDGYLKIRDANAVGDKAAVVQAENKDRKTAYQQIAQSLGISEAEVGRRQGQRNKASNR